jgi:hypothetical protein
MDKDSENSFKLSNKSQTKNHQSHQYSTEVGEHTDMVAKNMSLFEQLNKDEGDI